MKKISVIGATGQMGKAIVKVLHSDPEVAPGMGVEMAASKFIGMDIGMISGLGTIGELVTDSRQKAFQDSQGIIDFSSPSSSMETLEFAKKMKLPLVIGTTGFDDTQKEEIRKSSIVIPILLSPNMSLGVNLLFKLAAQTTRALKNHDFDIEVTEAHHRFKKDSPSGTAVRLAEILAEENESDYKTDLVYGREGITGPRTKKEIGIHAIRGGDIVGDHTIFFTSLGERIELTHRAHTRETFASGSVAAVKFLLNCQPGLYNMFDVLGLE